MTTIYILGAILVGYVLPAALAWQLTRILHRTRWAGTTPDGFDAILVLMPVFNIAACFAYGAALLPKGAISAKKFFRL